MDFTNGPKSDPPTMASTEESYQVRQLVQGEAEVTGATGESYYATETTFEETIADADVDASSTSVGKAFGLPTFDDSTFVDSSVME